MIRRIFLEKGMKRFSLAENSQTMNYDLQYLWSSFDQINYWMRIDKYEGWVTIWNSWDLKTQKWKDFISQEEKKKYNDEYAKYWWKKWKEMPRLEITEQNYEEVLHQWQQVQKDKKKYVIISIDDFGWVRIESKNKLSYQDEQDIKSEHEKYLEYRKKVDAHAPFRRRTRDEWESPEDEEYDSDFLTEEEMVWRNKRF